MTTLRFISHGDGYCRPATDADKTLWRHVSQSSLPTLVDEDELEEFGPLIRAHGWSIEKITPEPAQEAPKPQP